MHRKKARSVLAKSPEKSATGPLVIFRPCCASSDDGCDEKSAAIVRCGSRRTERKRSGKNSAATGTGDLPFFRWRVYGAREASQGSALRSDRYEAQRMRP